MKGGLSWKFHRHSGATYIHKNYQGLISNLRSWERMGTRIKVVLCRKSSIIFVNMQLRTFIGFPERRFALKKFFQGRKFQILINDVC